MERNSKGQFIKGGIPWIKDKHLIPWNKGKTGIYTKDTLLKMVKAGRKRSGSKNPSWKGGKIIKCCQSCHKKFKVFYYRGQQREAKFCSKLCRWKSNPPWEKGKPHCGKCNKKLSSYIYKTCKKCIIKYAITPKHKRIRKTIKYITWRNSVFKRDNWTCIWCFKKGGWNKEEKRRIVLNADHIKPFAYFPALRLNINNGRTLCLQCHKKTDTYLNR